MAMPHPLPVFRGALSGSTPPSPRHECQIGKRSGSSPSSPQNPLVGASSAQCIKTDLGTGLDPEKVCDLLNLLWNPDQSCKPLLIIDTRPWVQGANDSRIKGSIQFSLPSLLLRRIRKGNKALTGTSLRSCIGSTLGMGIFASIAIVSDSLQGSPLCHEDDKDPISFLDDNNGNWVKDIDFLVIDDIYPGNNPGEDSIGSLVVEFLSSRTSGSVYYSCKGFSNLRETLSKQKFFMSDEDPQELLDLYSLLIKKGLFENASRKLASLFQDPSTLQPMQQSISSMNSRLPFQNTNSSSFTVGTGSYSVDARRFCYDTKNKIEKYIQLNLDKSREGDAFQMDCAALFDKELNHSENNITNTAYHESSADFSVRNNINNDLMMTPAQDSSHVNNNRRIVPSKSMGCPSSTESAESKPYPLIITPEFSLDPYGPIFDSPNDVEGSNSVHDFPGVQVAGNGVSRTLPIPYDLITQSSPVSPSEPHRKHKLNMKLPTLDLNMALRSKSCSGNIHASKKTNENTDTKSSESSKVSPQNLDQSHWPNIWENITSADNNHIVSEIYPGKLYLGPDCADDDIRKHIEDLGITYVINVARELDEANGGALAEASAKAITDMANHTHHHVERVSVSMWDHVEERNVQDILEKVVHLINNALENNKKVYVHCLAGRSRSTTCVTAYVMWRNHWSVRRAYRFVHKCRSCSEPNVGFLMELLKYEEHILGSAKRGVLDGETPSEEVPKITSALIPPSS